MGHNRSSGLRKRGGIWHIDRQALSHRIHESTGTSELKTAELMLARRVEEIRQPSVVSLQPVRIFREASTRLLEENTNLATLRTYAFHIYYGRPVRSINNNGWKSVRRSKLDLPIQGTT